MGTSRFDFTWHMTHVDPDRFVRLDLSKWPMSLRARINAEKLSRNVGNRLVTKIKQRLRQGLTAKGTPIQPPVNGGKPMQRTGELIQSIRWKDGYVAAGWSKPRKEKLARKRNWVTRRNRQTGKMERAFVRGSVSTNFGLMIVLQLTGGEYRRRFQGGRKKDGEPFMRRSMIDLMGADEPKTGELIMQLARKELQRQLDAGEAGLAAELRSIAARNARLEAARIRRGQ